MWSLFAQSIQLSTPAPQVDINNPFTVAITVTDGPTWWTVNLDWVDNFDVVWQSTATTMQIINGVRKQWTQLQLQLKAKEKWVFELWPARIQWNWSLESNVVSVEIIGDKLFVNGTPQWWKPQNTQPSSQDVVMSKDTSVQSSSSIPLWIPLVVFLLASAWWIAAIVKKRKSIDHEFSVEVAEEWFVELWKRPSFDDEHYYDKALAWVWRWIALQTDQSTVGKSPEALRQVWLEYWYHGVDDEPIIDILVMIQLWLYQWDISEKEELHALLQSL